MCPHKKMKLNQCQRTTSSIEKELLQSQLQFTCSFNQMCLNNCCQITKVDPSIYCASFLPEPMYISNIVCNVVYANQRKIKTF